MRHGVRTNTVGIRLTKIQSLLLVLGQLLHDLLFLFVDCDYCFLTYKVAVRIKWVHIFELCPRCLMKSTNYPSHHSWFLFPYTKSFLGGLIGKESTCNVGDLGSIPGLGRVPGEGNGNPLQYSCLENPMDREAWWATLHRVTKSQTRLTNTFTFHMYVCVMIHIYVYIWFNINNINSIVCY